MDARERALWREIERQDAKRHKQEAMEEMVENAQDSFRAALRELKQKGIAERYKAGEASSTAVHAQTLEVLDDAIFHQEQEAHQQEYEQRWAEKHPEEARWQARLDDLGQLYQSALRAKGWDGVPGELVGMVNAARYADDPQKRMIAQRLALKTAEARQAGGDGRYREAMERIGDMLLHLAKLLHRV